MVNAVDDCLLYCNKIKWPATHSQEHIGTTTTAKEERRSDGSPLMQPRCLKKLTKPKLRNTCPIPDKLQWHLDVQPVTASRACRVYGEGAYLPDYDMKQKHRGPFESMTS